MKEAVTMSNDMMMIFTVACAQRLPNGPQFIKE